MELIPMQKGEEYMEVHPNVISQFKNLGWVECERREEKPKKDKKEQDK